MAYNLCLAFLVIFWKLNIFDDCKVKTFIKGAREGLTLIFTFLLVLIEENRRMATTRNFFRTEKVRTLIPIPRKSTLKSIFYYSFDLISSSVLENSLKAI